MVLSGAIPAVGHLHDTRLGIRRRGARLVLALLAKLSDGDERLVDPTLVVSRCRSSGRFLTGARLGIVGFGKDATDMQGGLLTAVLERLLPPKRGGRCARTHARAVLRDEVERHWTFVQEHVEHVRE